MHPRCHARARRDVASVRKDVVANPASLVQPALRSGLISAERLRFATHSVRRDVDALRAHVDALRTAAEVFRGHPVYAAPDRFVSRMHALLDGGTSDVGAR